MSKRRPAPAAGPLAGHAEPGKPVRARALPWPDKPADAGLNGERILPAPGSPVPDAALAKLKEAAKRGVAGAPGPAATPRAKAVRGQPDPAAPPKRQR